MGWYKELIHEETVEDVMGRWPRRGWSGCFAGVIRREVGEKPWANTSRLEKGEEKEFSRGVEANEVGKVYEDKEGGGGR